MALTNNERLRALPRRRFLALAAGGLALPIVGAACGDDDDASPATPGVATRAAASPTAAPAVKSGPKQGSVQVGDVLDHALWSEDWKGDFGYVTFRLHEGLVEEQSVYFIRTDASDKAFAEQEKLVYVPLMAKAAAGGGRGTSRIYVFEGAPNLKPVLSSAPHLADYSPAFVLHRVRFSGTASQLTSESAIRDAEKAGAVQVEATSIVVNYPVVKWPGGEMPVDTAKEVYLGGGQLLEPVDVAGKKVTFKLHGCYPASRYIVTDVTMPEMAGGMKIAPAPGAADLTAAGATAKILVFGNGLPGSGPMGFQKSVTDTIVGDAAWSPYWDHFTFIWKDGRTPRLLKSLAEIQAAESAGELTRFPGTPDTNGKLFMVNCPVPVLAAIS
ncbi:hypothetical protein [Tepidiforma sp.]|uniref:DUF7482 domain-containing protein n=1 Tax=Tepidiforma sp. TaxID=2682230 RepID=UPI002ADDA930|nr:hypothetical protein [Tepidiforma sp.]